MTDDLVKRLREEATADTSTCSFLTEEAADRIEKLEAALREIKAMHHEGGIDGAEERDDRTYCIVCDALEGKDD